MMSRRLVNLVMTDFKDRTFWFHRMDLSKLLFYQSTAEAEAAGVDKVKPPKIGKLQLPPLVMGFEPFPTLPTSSDWSNPSSSTFVLLHGPRSLSSEASRILFISSVGQTTMYDVDSLTVISVPGLTEHMRYRQITVMPIVTGDGDGAGAEKLYALRCGESEFKVLDFSRGDKRRASFPMHGRSSLQWRSLPPLPVQAANISSFTVVDNDRIICVSAGRVHSSDCNYGPDRSTLCFDTVSQEWWKAGDWDLPFDGRAEYVPELATWLGFSPDHPHQLCAADLSGVTTAPRQAPTLQHVWEDYNPPPTEETSLVLNKDYPGIVLSTRVDWSVTQHFLVNLGSGRFCVAKVVEGDKSVSLSWSMADSHEKPVAKVVEGEKSVSLSWSTADSHGKPMGALTMLTADSHEKPKGTLTMLTGVEVIRDGGDGELRMVKHKTRELVHPGLGVACVL